MGKKCKRPLQVRTNQKALTEHYKIAFSYLISRAKRLKEENKKSSDSSFHPHQKAISKRVTYARYLKRERTPNDVKKEASRVANVIKSEETCHTETRIEKKGDRRHRKRKGEMKELIKRDK